ncbi:MAG: VWA domain-containing protein [Cellvibrionaceae bacterium]|nr:VWA domain-containing protein [Cellvibrionaceae bacterium]
MTQAIVRLSVSCLCVLALSVLSAALYAQAPVLPKQADVRVVIDISGSMKKNDPQNLRRPALEMLLKLLPAGSRGGVWTFGQYVNMLVKHGLIDEAWKQQAAAKTQNISSIAQFTNIGEALEKTAYDRAYSDKPDVQTHIILLTDGMVDIDRDPANNVQERQRILNDILPAYQQANYKIHTISLSDNADKALMDRLAVATDGRSAIARSAEDLMGVFLQVFDQAVPKEELPLSGNTFLTDSSIEEFTALIFRQPGTAPTQLRAPDGATYTQEGVDPTLSWYASEHYDLVTVKRPLEGEWRIIAQLDPKSRITVVSDLRLVVKPLPANLLAEETLALSLALREDNQVITRAEFLELLAIDVHIIHSDSGQRWQQRLSEGLVPGNGVYATLLDHFKALGDYEVHVKVDGKSFQRQFSQRLSVRQPFSLAYDTINSDGKTQFQVVVSPQLKRIDLDKTEVVGKLKDPSGASHIVRFQLTDAQTWQWQMAATLEGDYHLSVRITTPDAQGQAQDFSPEPLRFSYSQDQDFFASLNEPEIPAPVVAEEQAVDANTSALVASLTAETPAQDAVNEAELLAAEAAEAEQAKNTTQWLLYGMLGVVNILIILVIYILYRKLFGRSAATDDEQAQTLDTAAEADPDSGDTAFEEPPMDEMNIGDLSDDIDLADNSSETQALDAAVEDDPLAELTPEALDDDEDPEFSLDDFAPDALDDDDEEEKSG